MGRYAPMENYNCQSCGHTYEYMQDTIFMATHKSSPTVCPKCDGTDIRKVEGKPLTNIDFEWEDKQTKGVHKHGII